MSHVEQAIPVRQLVRRMRTVLEVQIGELWVEGEVSNLRRQSSGHYYFSLKDNSAQISCAMFGARRNASSQLLEDGSKVLVFGEVTLYEARGQAQLIVKQVKSLGQGDLHARFEALKAKLQKENLFDQARKRSLPIFPHRIGIVTSPTGAALQDMVNVLQRRAPWLQVVLYPCAVQGRGAEHGIAAGIESLGKDKTIEAIIVGRGGGSLEDLWNFNEEIVAQAIVSSPHPVISAVGHEIDFTIADFVSDLRAPTPSAAAELIVPDRSELLQRLESHSEALRRRIYQYLTNLAQELGRIERFGFKGEKIRLIQDLEQNLDNMNEDFADAFAGFLDIQSRRLNEMESLQRATRPTAIIERAYERLEGQEEKLDRLVIQQLVSRSDSLLRFEELIKVMGPDSVLARGYSMTLDSDGVPIISAQSIAKGEKIVSRFNDGEVNSEVF